MTFSVYARFIVQGDFFSPQKWEQESGIVCSEKSERGSVFTTGSKIGQPQAFGYAKYDISEDWQELFLGKKPGYWERLVAIIENAKAIGAEKVHLQIDVSYPDQCNLYYTPEALAHLASLKIGVGISAYMSDDDNIRDEDGNTWKI